MKYLNNTNISIALFEPQIPQNTGTILRFCDCLGLEVFLIRPFGFIFGGKDMKRAGMDYLDSVKYSIFDSFDDFLKFSKEKNKRIILSTTKASEVLYDFSFKDNDVILFGSETKGVDEYIHNIISSRIKVAMLEEKRSLNLAVTVAIVASEAIRQLNISF